jgi:hypothetical protein
MLPMLPIPSILLKLHMLLSHCPGGPVLAVLGQAVLGQSVVASRCRRAASLGKVRYLPR